MLKLQGIFPPITTPFDHNGELYPAKIEHNIAKWNKLGLAGYVVTGSTGESVMLSIEEKKRQFEIVARSAAAGKLLIAGTGLESVRETVALCNAAADLGYHCALVRTPHYYKTQAARMDVQQLYFRAVADQSRIPVLIYNFPQMMGVDLPVDVVAALSEHPNIAGIKESSGSVEKVTALTSRVRAGFQVLVGNAPTLYASLQMGASGGILAFANAAPYACITVWEAFRTREHEAALDWQRRILEPARLVTAVHGIPGLKHAMDLNGYYGGPCRLPLLPLPESAKLQIQQAFAEIMG